MLIHLGWTGSPPPPRIIAAVETARKTAPGCEVLFHAGEDAVPAEWRAAMDRLNLSPHMRSDVQRHCILKQHGGLWLDADVRLLADPAEWAADLKRYTAIRLSEDGGFIGTDIIYVPAGWAGWEYIDGYIDSFFREPPARYSVLHLAGGMIKKVSRLHPDLFSILPPGERFPHDPGSFTAESLVARGFDPPAAPRPGLGDMAAAVFSAVGVTEARAQAVAKAVGFDDCGCGRRRAAWNRVGAALGLPAGSTEN